ncbi:hypothetical protein HDU81_006406 [Chytriomyces hyalinus]|nr:hypothetical protein HDU81_006406 [Chytriomyces hyalinus]
MHSINFVTWTVLAIVLSASAQGVSKRQFDPELDGISGFNDIGASEGIIGGDEGLIGGGEGIIGGEGIGGESVLGGSGGIIGGEGLIGGGEGIIGGEEGIIGGGERIIGGNEGIISGGERIIGGGEGGIVSGGRIIGGESRLGGELDDEFGDISTGFRGGLEQDGFDSVGSFWWGGNRIISNGFVNSLSNSFGIPRRTVQIIIIQMSRIRSNRNIFQSARRISRSNNVSIINLVRMSRLSWRYLRNRGFTRSNSNRNRNLIIVIRTMSSGSFVRRMRPSRVVVVIPSVSNRISRWSRQSRLSVRSWNSLIQDCFFQWSQGVWGRSGNVLLRGGSWSEGGFIGDSRFDSTWEQSWGSAESWITGSGCCDSFVGGDSLFSKKRRDADSDKMQTAAADFIDGVSSNADSICSGNNAATWMAKFSKTSGLDQTEMAGIAGEVVNMMMDDDITKDNMAMFDAFSCAAMAAVDMDKLPEALGKSVNESQDAAMNLLMETPAEAVATDKADKKATTPMTKEEMDAMTPAEKAAATKKPMTKEEMDAMPKAVSANSNKVAMTAEQMAAMPKTSMTPEEMAAMPKKPMTKEEMSAMPKSSKSAKAPMTPEEMAAMPMKAMTAEEMAAMPMKAMTPEEMAKMPKKSMTPEEMAKMPMKSMTPAEMANMPVVAAQPQVADARAAKSGSLMAAASSLAFLPILLF